MAALQQQLHSTEQQIAQDQQQETDLQSLEVTTAPTVDLDLGAGLSSGQSTDRGVAVKTEHPSKPLRTKSSRRAQTASRVRSGQGQGSGKPGSEERYTDGAQDPQPGDRSPVGTIGSRHRKTQEPGGTTARFDLHPCRRACRQIPLMSKRSGLFSVTTTLCRAAIGRCWTRRWRLRPPLRWKAGKRANDS